MVARSASPRNVPASGLSRCGTRKRLRTVLMIPLLAVSLLAAACGGGAGSGGKITLTFANWAAAESATRPGIQKAIQSFEATHPNIDIKSQAISFSEIAHQLVLRNKSGNPPDIAELAGNDTFLLAAAGALEPLDSYVDSGMRSKLKPASLRTLRHDGELIAFPWTLAPGGFWYNKKIMEEAGLDPSNPPRTIDELMAAMKAIKSSQPDVIPLALDTTNRTFSMVSNWPWMRAFGAQPVGSSGPAASSPAMKRYLSWMRELADKGYIQPGRKIGDFRPLAAQGKVAFMWDQVLLQGVIQQTNGMSDEEFHGTWGVTTQPTGRSGKSYSFGGGHQLAMFSDSEHKKAAWKFIKYLATSSKAVTNYTVGYESSLPPLAKAPTEELAAKLDTPVFNTFSKKVTPTVTVPPYGPDFADASTAVMAGVQQAVTSDKPIGRVARSIQRRLGKK